ncbi:MAG TPA: periplasmic heavy metal sensor [Aliidongia sp.]|uniref:periplasmic heavy metal sensor n=1 Tax=Aliidongia sp. TaxID=1914230 RepID=UPI002DDD8A9F|nr:periplasmic heavy metal sensor [Aliidongia sp.]HEV2673576.1 periplasmic heavy metal sensor [Aliidongia sp.]
MSKLRVPRLIEVALVLSLALNLFVAGGFAYSQYTTAHPAPAAPTGGGDRRLERFASKLGLDPEKSKSFKEWRRSLHSAQGVLYQQNQPLVEEAWSELSQPAPDSQHVQQILDEIAQHRRAFQADTTAATIKFLGTLDESQRKTFMATVIDRANPLAGPIRNTLGN